MFQAVKKDKKLLKNQIKCCIIKKRFGQKDQQNEFCELKIG